MRTKPGPTGEDIKYLLLTDKYLLTLDKIGFSKDFLLKEQIKRQKECIEYLAQKIDELHKEILLLNKKVKNKETEILPELLFNF